MLDKVPGLVEVLGADGVVLDKLDVVVLGDVPLAVVSDAIHHGDTEVLDRSQQILSEWIFHFTKYLWLWQVTDTLYPMRYLHTALEFVSLISCEWERKIMCVT